MIAKMQTIAFAWDDLRFVLAIARSGNLAAAAQALGVNHSTMFRRLNAVEKALGSKLFERLATGYRPTESGLRLIETAERMETEALALDRDLTGRDTRLSGQLRVTCSETLGFKILTTEIARFNTLHPGIGIDLSVDNRVIDLSRREADVALRATRPSEGDLFGRKIADIGWGLFASTAYVKTHGAPKRVEDLTRHTIIGWSQSAPPTRAAGWLAKHVPPSAIGFRSSTILNQYVAAADGLGVALLPVYLPAGDRRVTRLLALKDLTTEMWIVTHRSLKDTARVRAFMEIVGDGVKRAIAELGR
jgi:DNA-binding transcriptional LysR family regulator